MAVLHFKEGAYFEIQHYFHNKCNHLYRKANIFPISLRKKSVLTQPAFTYSKLTIETLEKGVKYVQRTIKIPERRLASFWCLYC